MRQKAENQIDARVRLLDEKDAALSRYIHREAGANRRTVVQQIAYMLTEYYSKLGETNGKQ